jgi:hypothetical protein
MDLKGNQLLNETHIVLQVVLLLGILMMGKVSRCRNAVKLL